MNRNICCSHLTNYQWQIETQRRSSLVTFTFDFSFTFYTRSYTDKNKLMDNNRDQMGKERNQQHRSPVFKLLRRRQHQPNTLSSSIRSADYPNKTRDSFPLQTKTSVKRSKSIYPQEKANVFIICCYYIFLMDICFVIILPKKYFLVWWCNVIEIIFIVDIVYLWLRKFSQPYLKIFEQKNTKNFYTVEIFYWSIMIF
jgi:hypothetical protein